MTQGSSPSPYPGAPQQGGQPWQSSPAPQSPAGQPAWHSSPAPAAPPQWQSVPQGAGGAPVSPGTATNWTRIRKLGMAMLILGALAALGRVIVDLSTLALAGPAAEMDVYSGTGDALAVAHRLLALVVGGSAVVLSGVLLVVAIIVAVTATGKARVGAIVVAVAVPVSVIAFWLVSLVAAIIATSLGLTTIYGTLTAGGYRLGSAFDLVRILLTAAVYVYGSLMVIRTAKANGAA